MITFTHSFAGGENLLIRIHDKRTYSAILLEDCTIRTEGVDGAKFAPTWAEEPITAGPFPDVEAAKAAAIIMLGGT